MVNNQQPQKRYTPFLPIITLTEIYLGRSHKSFTPYKSSHAHASFEVALRNFVDSFSGYVIDVWKKSGD